MHAYLKSLEVSNFKGFSAYFARMSPLGVYTYAFGFHSDNLTPFWTVSQRVDRFIDTLSGTPQWSATFLIYPLVYSIILLSNTATSALVV